MDDVFNEIIDLVLWALFSDVNIIRDGCKYCCSTRLVLGAQEEAALIDYR